MVIWLGRHVRIRNDIGISWNNKVNKVYSRIVVSEKRWALC